MAGHNKWSKVKHIKAKEDAKKGKIFAKCSHEISLAAKSGGDPDLNPRLRMAIDFAKSVSMPKDNIDRAIKKGTGELGGEAIQEITYEGYGPQGTAFVIEVATDNLNRSASDIRTIFNKNGGSIGTPGSVAYQFDRKGEINFSAQLSEDDAMELAMECEAEDIAPADEENCWVMTTEPASLAAAAQALASRGHTPTSQQLVLIPQNPTLISSADLARSVIRLYELLDDYNDSMNVFTNFDIAPEILEQLEN